MQIFKEPDLKKMTFVIWGIEIRHKIIFKTFRLSFHPGEERKRGNRKSC